MRRVALVLAVLIGGLAALPSAQAGPRTGKAARTVALVRVADCARGPQAADRHAIFRGAMRRVAHTGRMSMRFALQERVGAGRFRTVRAPGLGRWRKSRPGVGRFSHRQRVLELAVGSAYRVVVSFRWHDGDGQVVRRARRRSRSCSQPGPLSNLRLLRIGGGLPLAGAPLSSIYNVRVANRGQVATPRFGVSLAVDGGIVDRQSVGALSPGEVRQLSFAGPACARSLTARADPEDAVRETSERDNVLTVPCPPRR